MQAVEDALIRLWNSLTPEEKSQKWALISYADRVEIERLIPGTNREMVRYYMREAARLKS